MKSINKFIGLALLSGALLTSCSDSFLQRDSLTESSSNTFWQTPDDALMALASCYDALQSNQMCIRDRSTCIHDFQILHRYIVRITDTSCIQGSIISHNARFPFTITISIYINTIFGYTVSGDFKFAIKNLTALQQNFIARQ